MEKNDTTVSTDAGEKSVWQKSKFFFIKTLNKPRIEGNYFNIIKTTYENSTAHIILNGDRLKAFPPRSELRQECLLLLLSLT